MTPNVPVTPEKHEPIHVATPEGLDPAELIALEVLLLRGATELARMELGGDEATPPKPEPVNIPTAFAEAFRGG